MKNDNTIMWIIGIVVLVVLISGNSNLGLFATAGDSMSRDVPSIASPGQQFNVVYSTSVSGTWGSSIVDSISGGCKFPDGSNQLKTVMLSVDGGSKSIKVTAPSSGSCTFSGDYKFGTEATKNFADNTITITNNSNCHDYYWFDDSHNVCGYNEFCGAFMYLGLETFNSMEECEIALDGNGKTPLFDIRKVLFKIGEFEITALVILIGFGGLFALSFLRK